ncbi:7789_t:CDS:2 [Ambispora gerdemannii]|uniref:7789_t:CDS:1 n=1 Tax=Ambispora gerdemannii TaxID=144530 RepID=A0A9N8V138_9GLOM|nr:7789_t:CDS:2 [Ambispora gerdemannii]
MYPPPLFESGANTGFVQTLQSKDTTHVVDATTSSLKRTSESTPVDKSSNKKVKKAKLESPSSSSSTIASQTKTITNSGNFTDLYNVIIKAEERIESTNQEAQKKLIEEVAKQLPNDLPRNAIEKRVKGQGSFITFSKLLVEKDMVGTA